MLSKYVGDNIAQKILCAMLAQSAQACFHRKITYTMLFWSAWVNTAQGNYLCIVDPQSMNNFAQENNLQFCLAPPVYWLKPPLSKHPPTPPPPQLHPWSIFSIPMWNPVTIFIVVFSKIFIVLRCIFNPLKPFTDNIPILKIWSFFIFIILYFNLSCICY